MITRNFYSNTFLIFLVVLYICISYLSAENNSLLTLKVYKNKIIVFVNGKIKLKHKINVSEGQLGLYFYSPEEDNYKQYANNLIITDLSGSVIIKIILLNPPESYFFSYVNP